MVYWLLLLWLNFLVCFLSNSIDLIVFAYKKCCNDIKSLSSKIDHDFSPSVCDWMHWKFRSPRVRPEQLLPQCYRKTSLFFQTTLPELCRLWRSWARCRTTQTLDYPQSSSTDNNEETDDSRYDNAPIL